MAVELQRNMSRQPSRESNNGSMASYNSEGRSDMFSTTFIHRQKSETALRVLNSTHFCVLLALFLECILYNVLV